MNHSHNSLPDLLASIRQSATSGHQPFLSHIRPLLCLSPATKADLPIHHAITLQVVGAASDGDLLMLSSEVIGASFQMYKKGKESSTHDRVLLVQEVADKLVQILEQGSNVPVKVDACLRLLQSLCDTIVHNMSQVVRFVVRRVARALGTSSFDPSATAKVSSWVLKLCGDKFVGLTHEVDILAALQGSLTKAAIVSVGPVTLCVLEWMNVNANKYEAFASWMDTLLRIAAIVRKQPTRVKGFVESVEKAIRSKEELRLAITRFLRKAVSRSPSSFDMFLGLKCKDVAEEKELGVLALALVERCESDEVLQAIVSDLGLVNVALLHELCDTCLDVITRSVQAQACIRQILLVCKSVRLAVANRLLRDIPALKPSDKEAISKAEACLRTLEDTVQEVYLTENVRIRWDSIPNLPSVVKKGYMRLLGRSITHGSPLTQELQSAICTWRSSGDVKLVQLSYETLQQVAIASNIETVRKVCTHQVAKLVHESPEIRDSVLLSIYENMKATIGAKEILGAIMSCLIELLCESAPLGCSLKKLLEVHQELKILQLIRCLSYLTNTVKTRDELAERMQAWMDEVRTTIACGSFKYLSDYATKADLALRSDFLVNLCDVCSLEKSCAELLVPRSIASNLRQLSGQAPNHPSPVAPSIYAVHGAVQSTLKGTTPLCASAFLLRDFNVAKGLVDSGLLDAMIMLVKDPPAMGEADLALARQCKTYKLPAPDVKEMRSLLFEETLKGLSSCEKEVRESTEALVWSKRACSLSHALSKEIKRGLNGKLLQVFGSTILEFMQLGSQDGEHDDETKSQVRSTCMDILKRYTFSSPMAIRCLFSIILSPYVSSLQEMTKVATDVIRMCGSKKFFDVGKDRIYPIHKSCRDTATKEGLSGYLTVLGRAKESQVDDTSLQLITEGLQSLLSKVELKWLSLSAKHKLLATTGALTSYFDRQATLLSRASIQHKLSEQPLKIGQKMCQADAPSYFAIEWSAPEGTFEVDFKNLEKRSDAREKDPAENRPAWSVLLDILSITARVRKWKKLADRGQEEEMKAKLTQLCERIIRAEERLKGAIQRLVQRANNPSLRKQTDHDLPPISREMLIQLGKRITFENGIRPKPKRDLASVNDTDPELGWMFQAPKKKRVKTTLRSANAFIDAALVEEDGTDDYQELEEFIVCTNGKVY